MNLQDMLTLKKRYMDLKSSKMELERKIDDLRKQNSKERAFLMQGLKRERADLLANKDLRDNKYNISNQELWKTKIQELTQRKEDDIEEVLGETEKTIKDMEISLRNMALDIESLHWDLKINLAFVQEKAKI